MKRAVSWLAVLLTALVCGAAPAGAAQVVNARAVKARTVSARAVTAPPLAVTGASLFVQGSDTPLWSRNGNAQLPIASATKMMTALVVLQHVRNLNTVFTQNDWTASSADSQIGLIPGERMTVHDLLVALLLPSADDAAEDLAYNVGGGSIARFLAMMNADARALGLRHTHYTTPSGLDTPGNYSSPDDLVRLGQYLMAHWPFFRHTVRLSHATLTSGRYRRHVVSTDLLVGKVPWIDGIKTGHTAAAGYVLVSQGRRHGLTLTASVLGTASEAARDANALALLNWGFATFEPVRPVRAGERFAERSVEYESRPALIVAERGYQTVLARDEPVRVVVGRLHRLSPPMAKGTVVGDLRVTVRGRPSVQIPLILGRRLPAVSELTKVGHLLMRPITLLLVALLIVGAAVAVAERRRRPRALATRLQKR